MEERTRPEQDPLLDTFRTAVIGGRWLLVIAATLESLLLAATGGVPPAGWTVLGCLLLYNLASLVLVHRLPVRRIPVLAILALDLLFVGAMASVTGGAQSPFLGQCYLIIYAGALFYGLSGGLTVGFVSALLATALTFQNPADVAWDSFRGYVPYFLIAGAFAGFLSERLRLWHRRYQAGRDEARERELEDRIAEREFQLARAMQRAAMPSVPPAIPGLELAVRSRFARQVSGDFYMFLPDEKSVGVIIGDVSGKGLPAALVSTSIGHLLPWLHPLRSPGNALKNLNRDLLDRLPTESFVSLTLINLDLARGCVTLWNCGHPPPLLWRAREQRLVEGTLFNPVLGIFAGWEGHPERWDCEPGDVLLLCTDGLLEVRNADGEQFEAQRAGATLAEHAALPAEEIADALLRAAESWGTLTDDVTLVVCKRVPVAPGAGEPLHGSPYPG